jgi:hypothetical protein
MMRYVIAACAGAVLLAASVFLADIGPIWP